MSSIMYSKDCFANKGFLTFTTFIGLLSCMYFLMFSKTGLFIECFTTHTIFKSFLSYLSSLKAGAV